MTDNHALVQRIHNDLLKARKTRDVTATKALQSLAARITNAEAVTLPPQKHLPTTHIGVGSTEAPRRILTDEDIQRIVHDELTDIKQALDSLASQPDHPYTRELRERLRIISSYTT